MIHLYYNDYKETIKNYLRHRTEWTVYIENLKQDISDCENTIHLNAAPKIPHLSFTPGSGSDSQTQQEKTVDDKNKIALTIVQLRNTLNQLEPTMAKLDRSLAGLKKEDRDLIVWRWCDRHSWEEVAGFMNVTERSCKRKNNIILDQLANMMFGPNSAPDNVDFVFYGVNSNKMVKQ